MFRLFNKKKSEISHRIRGQTLKQPAVFLHIQKTAGTTIVSLVKSCLGKELVTSHGDYLETDSFDPTTKPFISGHFGFDYAKELIESRYSFTFLRDPAERVLSFYYFCRQKDPDQFPIYKLAHELSLDAFLAEGLSNSLIAAYILNSQVWQLAHGYGSQSEFAIDDFNSDALLDLAIKNSGMFSHVGFTETFEKDRDIILAELGLPLPSKKVVYNAGLSRPLKNKIPESTQRLLNRLTRLDSALYEHVRSLKVNSL